MTTNNHPSQAAKLGYFWFLKFSDLNVIITGATKGIGRAIGDLLLSKGHNIAFCARSKDDVDALTLEWKNEYPNQEVIGAVCDMGVKDEVETFAVSVMSQMKEIDVLVNNAGVFLPGEILKEEAGALEQMINVNLYSAYHLTRKIAPVMTERGSGHIFNMCSVASIKAYPNGGSYSISKFALLGFSKVLREELKPLGVKVTSILPGATWSNSWAGVDLPRERLMEAHDIAMSVANAIDMSPSAVVEEIIVRPQLGDL